MSQPSTPSSSGAPGPSGSATDAQSLDLSYSSATATGRSTESASAVSRHGHTVHGGDLFRDMIFAHPVKKRPRGSVSFSDVRDAIVVPSILSARHTLIKRPAGMPLGANTEATWLLTARDVEADGCSLNLKVDEATGAVRGFVGTHDSTLHVGDRIVAINGLVVAPSDVWCSLPSPPAFVHLFVRRESVDEEGSNGEGQSVDGAEGGNRKSFLGLVRSKRAKSVGSSLDALGTAPPAGAESLVDEEAHLSRPLGVRTHMRFVHSDEAMAMRFGADGTVEALPLGMRGGRLPCEASSPAAAAETPQTRGVSETSGGVSLAGVSPLVGKPGQARGLHDASGSACDVRVGDRLVAINGSTISPSDDGVQGTLQRLADERATRRGGLAGRRGLLMLVLERPAEVDSSSSSADGSRRSSAEASPLSSPRASRRASLTAQFKQFYYQVGRAMDTRRTSLCRGGGTRAHVLAQRLADDLAALALREERTARMHTPVAAPAYASACSSPPSVVLVACGHGSIQGQAESPQSQVA